MTDILCFPPLCPTPVSLALPFLLHTFPFPLTLVFCQKREITDRQSDKGKNKPVRRGKKVASNSIKLLSLLLVFNYTN